MAKPSQLELEKRAVVGESAMQSEDDIGSQIDYEFRVITSACLYYSTQHKASFVRPAHVLAVG